MQSKIEIVSYQSTSYQSLPATLSNHYSTTKTTSSIHTKSIGTLFYLQLKRSFFQLTLAQLSNILFHQTHLYLKQTVKIDLELRNDLNYSCNQQ